MMNRPVSERVRRMIADLPVVRPAPGLFQPATAATRRAFVDRARGVLLSTPRAVTDEEVAEAAALLRPRVLQAAAQLAETTPPAVQRVGCAAEGREGVRIALPATHGAVS